MKKSTRYIGLAVLIILGLFYGLKGLVLAKGFLTPLIVAGLLAMTLMPLSNKLETIGLPRAWSALVSVLLTLGFVVGLLTLVSFEVNRVAEDWHTIKRQLKPQLERVDSWITQKTGVDFYDTPEILGTNNEPKSQNNQKISDTTANKTVAESAMAADEKKDSIPSTISGALMTLIGVSGQTLLTLVYLFFILLYRQKIFKSILKFFKKPNHNEASQAMSGSVKVAQQYLIGRFILILILAVLYSIGLSLSGVKHAILVSVIAAALSLVPYVGNIVGFVLAMAMAAFAGLGLGVYAGVVATFAIAQFVESYMLEPYVVGNKVDLHPLATIIVTVLGGSLWGIVGMIIFIPLFGIIKILCDHVEILQPIGYALGSEDSTTTGEGTLLRWGRKLKSTLGIG